MPRVVEAVEKMPIETIMDWNGCPIQAVRSRGGTWAFPDYGDALVRTGIAAWPPHEVIQKLHRSDKFIYFQPADQPILQSKLGHYVDLQSANSEDAAVWSYFGPLARSSREARTEWAAAFLGLFCTADKVKDCEISLWRRVPHPDSLSSGGPELDVCVTTDSELIVIEAKWRATEGHWQGAEGISTQMQLRSRFLVSLGKNFYPGMRLRLVYVMLDAGQSLPTREDGIDVACILWSRILRETPHPLQGELLRYFRWKWALVPRRPGQPTPELF